MKNTNEPDGQRRSHTTDGLAGGDVTMPRLKITQASIDEHIEDGCVRDWRSNYAPENEENQWLWDALTSPEQSRLNLTATQIMDAWPDEPVSNQDHQ